MGRLGVVSPGSRRIVSAVPARGEVWWCELAEIGRRPAVVLVERLGRLTDARLREICRALAVAVDCQS